MEIRTLLPAGPMARRLGVTRQELLRAAQAGQIPCVRVGDTYLFHRDAVVATLTERAQRTEAGPGGDDEC